MLIHEMHRWSEAITQYLWQDTVPLAVDVRNRCKLDKNVISSLDKLSTVKHSLNLQIVMLLVAHLACL